MTSHASDRRLVACLAAAAFVACDPDPSATPSTRPLTEFPHATATPDCAPWDGAAVTILLTRNADTTEPVAAPFVRVTLYESEDRLVGRTIRWPADRDVGGASWCDADDTCVGATAGVVSVDALDGDSVLPGRLRLTFPDRAPLDGAFRAIRRPRLAMCG